MFRQFISWRSFLAFIAILIVSGTVWYSSYLANKIEKEERQKVEEWVEASSSLFNLNTVDTRLHFKIIKDVNDDIPIIATDEKDSIIANNLDTAGIIFSHDELKSKLRQYKSENQPIIHIVDSSTPPIKYYYGQSQLLKQVRYYPLVQLFIVGLFILITIQALRTSFRSTQNHLWAGMAKETAHQLGTPVSSLEGWVEILKETHSKESFVSEIEKDVSRLRLVSDRFGKIGSTPKLETKNVVVQIATMMEYMRKRAGGRIKFHLNTNNKETILVKISAPLFDWVIENLLKNALDAMEGKGNIKIDIAENEKDVIVDIADSGKGISKQNLAKVFKPGFTTKKRGWGLGLSLSKRVIDQYHKGSLTVKNSELGKGTTFRIVLKK